MAASVLMQLVRSVVGNHVVAGPGKSPDLVVGWLHTAKDLVVFSRPITSRPAHDAEEHRSATAVTCHRQPVAVDTIAPVTDEMA